MRVALVNNFAPYLRGGAEILVDDLVDQLRQHGHDPVLFRIPWPESFSRLPSAVQYARMMQFDEFDRVIAFKFPAYCINHQAKVMWLFHQYRQVYDLWDSDYGHRPAPVSNSIRKFILDVDRADIPESRHIFTIGQEVSKRLLRFNGIHSVSMMYPLNKQDTYYSNSTGNYLYYPSRINSMKRQHLVVEAMGYVKSDVRLVISGLCESVEYLDNLKQIINRYGIEKKVSIRNEWITDEEKKALYSNALGVFYIPYFEDSCGLVTMEAFYSSKPVITCSDSGGALELVQHGISGLEAEPTPQALAEAMDRLFEDKKEAEQLGLAAFSDVVSRNITWTTTIERLLG